MPRVESGKRRSAYLANETPARLRVLFTDEETLVQVEELDVVRWTRDGDRLIEEREGEGAERGGDEEKVTRALEVVGIRDWSSWRWSKEDELEDLVKNLVRKDWKKTSKEDWKVSSLHPVLWSPIGLTLFLVFEARGRVVDTTNLLVKLPVLEISTETWVSSSPEKGRKRAEEGGGELTFFWQAAEQ